MPGSTDKIVLLRGDKGSAEVENRTFIGFLTQEPLLLLTEESFSKNTPTTLRLYRPDGTHTKLVIRWYERAGKWAVDWAHNI